MTDPALVAGKDAQVTRAKDAPVDLAAPVDEVHVWAENTAVELPPWPRRVARERVVICSTTEA